MPREVADFGLGVADVGSEGLNPGTAKIRPERLDQLLLGIHEHPAERRQLFTPPSERSCHPARKRDSELRNQTLGV
jgi:hypothetical protein